MRIMRLVALEIRNMIAEKLLEVFLKTTKVMNDEMDDHLPI